MVLRGEGFGGGRVGGGGGAGGLQCSLPFFFFPIQADYTMGILICEEQFFFSSPK